MNKIEQRLKLIEETHSTQAGTQFAARMGSQDIPFLLALVRRQREALVRAEQLASIADDWNLGQDGKVEIGNEWVACSTLRREFHDAAHFIPEGQEWRYIPTAEEEARMAQ